MRSFQLVGIPHEPFAPLFELSEAQLRERNVERVIADSKPGYPCRISLEDAEIGEELLLLPYEHLAADSPYRASGPIFVRKNVAQRILPPGVVPHYVSSRLISFRAYDSMHHMVDAVVCPGGEAGATIERLFANGETTYLHLHNANRGCFSCSVRPV
jgi:hypothetical protein